eukprot:1722360-Amphidinium_carterae.2
MGSISPSKGVGQGPVCRYRAARGKWEKRRPRGSRHWRRLSQCSFSWRWSGTAPKISAPAWVVADGRSSSWKWAAAECIVPGGSGQWCGQSSSSAQGVQPQRSG